MSIHYENILVAVDGSTEAEYGFKKAMEMAKLNGANLILTHVIDTRTYTAVEAYDRTSAERANTFAKELMEKYKNECFEAGITHVEYEIEYGSPKVKIPKDIAKKYNVDLIICGATGLNAVERFLIGSVSEQITRHAPCDVLVVRPSKTMNHDD
ncbi:nucleotide-binding universal stress UspA family protein [Cytobacillus horneckiae]|uniref:Universal stress protein n=1 Tax=Cytobacillus horneckiae TaxID=549687 RepID=A0A2N0ZMF0_9BACI|nr:universal stress protein [Cytobacillus horneckiae]NRG44677.1 universal stress protein [Bacillus sp. CRN 9]MBN6887992.1 universal stress protein [Cytobacillus horneckiae]MCM3179597.1 universal stress protein [Cytobacillus horneckiae]MEC1155042.1 universal stress protein [Cytobacillus horneckiae]MED2936052.1 universal stress protein [Cytobacillus horneckiae]